MAEPQEANKPAGSAESGKAVFGVSAEERLIDLPGLLEDLVAEGFLSRRQAEDVIIAPRTQREQGMHPMEIVAAREYDNRNDPGHKLDLETMTTWLAERARQPYLRIDPLQINVNAVTEVMSYAFAQRHHILAVEVSDDEVVIASGQPWMFQWEGMLTQTLRGRRIRRVVAQPGGHHPLCARVLHHGAFGVPGGAGRTRSLRHRQLRAASGTRAAQVAGRQ